MHEWGDEGVDWESIEAATSYIADYCRKWGRIGGQAKEKYGTVRFYCRMGNLSLHSLMLPGYYHYGWFPTWLIRLDHKVISPILNLFFGGMFYKWQTKVYERAYKNALHKWPHIQREILCMMDYPELLKGHVRFEGKHKHILDLSGKIVSTWTSA